MFSFIRKYAETMNGAEVYPKFAMFLFLIVFLAMLWFGLKADKGYIAELEQMPLKGHDGISPIHENGLSEQINEPKNAHL
jgi:hypothetical protein